MASIAQVDTQREALRQRSIGDIISGYDVQSNIEGRPVARALQQAQTEDLQARLPYAAQGERARIEDLEARTIAHRASTQTENTVRATKLRELEASISNINARSDLTRAQKDAEVATLQPRIDSMRTQIAATEQQTERSRQLLPGDITRQAIGNAEYIDIPYTDPVTGEKKTFKTTGSEVQKLRDAQSKSEQEQLQEAATVESNLISPPIDKHGKALSDEAMAPNTDVFNALSNKPYVYITIDQPGTLYGSSKKNVSVPIEVPGITARDIYRAATARKITVKEYLEKIHFPQLGKKAPWLPQ